MIEILENLSSLDLTSSRSSIIELAIVLEDRSLHPVFTEKNGMPILIGLLSKSLLIDENLSCTSIVSSIVTALLSIASFNLVVQKELAADNDILMNLIRYDICYSPIKKKERLLTNNLFYPSGPLSVP